MTNDNADALSPAEWMNERRRALGYDKSFNLPNGYLDKFIARLPEKEREAARAVWVSRLGKPISEIQDNQMSEYLAAIKPFLTKRELDAVESTYFGVYPTGRFAGQAGRVPRGDRIILLHHGLCHSIAIWAHWYLKIWENNGIEFLEKNLGTHTEVLEYFVALWTSQNYGLMPEIHPESSDAWDLSETLAIAGISFVLGHEIGHIVYEHHGYTSDVSKNHQQEFDADLFGLKIVARRAIAEGGLHDTYFTKFQLFGPVFVLAMLNLLSENSSPTHPSAECRRLALLKKYPVVICELLNSRAYEELLSQLDPNVFELFTSNSSNLQRLCSASFQVIEGARARVLPKKPIHADLLPWL